MRSFRKPAASVWIFTLAFVVTAHAANESKSTARETTPPNILLIMSDDMGYSDLGCYGGEMHTPTLDALAAGGVRFTQFYNTARCCPTRASLLTGLYPHQAGVGHMVEDRGFDGYRGVLNRNCVTLAEVLQPAGYRTYMCGKWHVTRFQQPDADRGTWPLGRGFEKFYGTITGAGNFFDPNALTRDNTRITAKTDTEYSPATYYYTDALSDNAVKYLQQHKQESPDKPFFMYLAYTAAHWPMHALEKDIAKNKGRFDAGYEQLRAERLARMKKLGLVREEEVLSSGAGKWANVKDKERELRCMEVYAAMIENMDAGIGRIVEQLKASGQFDNTLILFLQDNGGCAEEIGRKNGEATALPGGAETHIGYGQKWANVSNTPFREYKHWVHEGGISTPLVAHWPAGIPRERAGKLETQPGHLVDIMATLVDVSGATYPEERGGQKIKPREGVSLRPALAGKSLARTNPIFWEHEGNRAIRAGDWKLVAKANQPWELYNLAEDRSEQHNIAGEQPERVKELAAQWQAYAERANVLPLGAWRGRNAGGNEGKLSAKRRFELKPGTNLAREVAPAIAQRGFTITAKFELSPKHESGVLVAQGGSVVGYALLLDEGAPLLLVRSTDGVAKIRGEKLPAGEHTLVAKINSEGELSLEVDGKSAAAVVQGKLIDRMPTDGLNVGRDDGGFVGDYTSPLPFGGEIASVVIEIDRK